MQDFVAKFVPHLAHVDHAFASGLRAGVVAALLLGVLPVMLPLGVLGPWIAAPVLVGLTASRVGIAVAAQLTAARWGIASDHETNAASRASWVDVGFVLSVGAVVDGLWTHNLGPAALLCMFAAVLFAVTPRGRRALGMANDSYIKSKESVVIGKTTFVAFLQTTVTIGDLIEDLRTELRDFPWQERLDPKHKADYAHAGMPSDMIAKIYDITGDDEIRQLERLLTAARAQARKRATPVPAIRAAFVQPAPAVPFVFRVGRHVEMRIEVTHPNRRKLPRVIWLQPVVSDARAAR